MPPNDDHYVSRKITMSHCLSCLWFSYKNRLILLARPMRDDTRVHCPQCGGGVEHIKGRIVLRSERLLGGLVYGLRVVNYLQESYVQKDYPPIRRSKTKT